MKHCFLKKKKKKTGQTTVAWEKYTVMRLSGNEQKGFHNAVSVSLVKAVFFFPLLMLTESELQ